MTQQDNASSTFQGSGLPLPPVVPKPVLPLPSSGFLPPPPTSAQFIVRTSSTSLTPQPSLNFDDDDDDDWDDFQANEDSFGDASNQPVEEPEIDEPQASISHPSTTATDHKEDVNGIAGTESESPPSHGDSFVDLSNRTVDKEGKLEDESSVSSPFNSTPSPSRVQPEDEDEDDMWDAFESAPAATQSATEDTSTESQQKPDDDVWDSSLPDEVEGSQLDESKSSESPGPDVKRKNVEESIDLKSTAEVSHETESVEESRDLKGDSESSVEVSPGHVDVDNVAPEDGDVFEEAVEETDANPSLDGDVFEEAEEGELDANPSLQGENDNHAEAQEVPSESNSHKQQGIDQGGLVALAGAEAEENPLEN